MMIRAIHHAQVTVPADELKAAREFYIGFLGLPETERPKNFRPGGFWVVVGERTLHVGSEEDIDRQATRAHVAYEVDDLADIRRKLIAAGHEIEDPPPIPGHVRIHTRDPFGNLLEFIQPVEAGE